MKNFKFFLFIFSTYFFWGGPTQSLGQDLITICSESTAKQLEYEGRFVTGRSYEARGWIMGSV